MVTWIKIQSSLISDRDHLVAFPVLHLRLMQWKKLLICRSRHLSNDWLHAVSAVSMPAANRLARVTSNALEALIHAFARSCLDYCNSVLFDVAAVYLIQRQAVLNAAVVLLPESACLIYNSSLRRVALAYHE